ncbi:NAD(P)/FAD-dependent oxidoreductase [Desulforhopalus singaporensis]|uniref:Thioredoxin reductase (NADPH) n=1 Tax=Desulforhopalus singaporensis TaxID=91360 RepID=A0A1H0VNR4_9BACT|nr:NAD(P)/FAD-dependent oxidoreductase [Desulforhopalus singaporensis]SDP80157.1 thioredoxin reductase (NADPH) [Desulforhopalus singaporensis]
MKPEKQVDLVIIGGGPAGMTAAIYAAQANLDTLILEESVTGGLVNSTHTVQNFPSYPKIHGMELMEKMKEHVDHLSIPVEEVCEVESLSLEREFKTIETDEAVFHSKAVILATGRKPIPLDLQTECEEVHYCAICDGGAYKGKRVLVVGGGNSGFDESLYLLQIDISHLTLIEVEDRFFAAESTQEQLLADKRVEARTGAKLVDLCLEDGHLAGAVIKDLSTGNHETIPVDGIFVFLGQTPNNELFKNQVALSDNGYIKAGPNMETNLPGVYSAGDINDKIFRQITTAMGDATIAALSAERYIRNLKRSML